MINCSDNTYYIFYTDNQGGAIAIAKSALDRTTIDISLIGKTRLEYGQTFNENILHLVEHFASPSDLVLVPDQNRTYMQLLASPVIGQIWYNSTSKSVNVCVNNNPIEWRTISSYSEVAGNSGILSDGEYIPLPIGDEGYEFKQSECVWHVSPYFLSTTEQVLGFDISSDNRLVNCKYTVASGEKYGLVNYIILGIKDGVSPDQIDLICPTPTPTITPSTTPAVTPTPQATSTPAVTPTRTQSVGASPTPRATSTPAVTPTPAVTQSVTPTQGAQSSPTPRPTSTPAVTGTPAVTPTPQVSPTPEATPSITPTQGVSSTPAATRTPQATSTPAPTNTPAPTSTPASTPTSTPPVTPTSAPTNTPASTPPVTPSATPFPPMSLGPASNLDVANFFTWTIPCDFPAPTTPGLSASGSIQVLGGSGSFTYSWSRTIGIAGFATTFSGSGNTFTVADTAASRTCPYQGSASGSVSVLVTDTVTGLQRTFNGEYLLEYTG